MPTQKSLIQNEKNNNDVSQFLPADVLLIYPYFYTHAPKAMLFHPLGIAQLAAILRSRGLLTHVIDCTFEHRDDIISKIILARPRIVGIYAMISMSENAVALAGTIRKVLPETLLVCGGPLPTLKPGHFSSVFDAVFCGEADISFPGFALIILNPTVPRQIFPCLQKIRKNIPGSILIILMTEQ
jgi:radical SAM superfamily enzyme YgiQ (UPF0313 family)